MRHCAKSGRVNRCTGIGFWLCALALGCDDSSTPSDLAAKPRTTLLQIDPSAFLDGVPCAPLEGALQSYVATLFDVTPTGDGGAPSEPVELVSSPVASCLQSVVFGQPATGTQQVVAPGHMYAARVEAYARAPEDVEAALEKGDPVEPDWTADCGRTPLSTGEPQAPASMAMFQETTVLACDPLRVVSEEDEEDEEPATQVTVAFSKESCDRADVDRYVVVYEGEEYPGECDGTKVVLPVVLGAPEPGKFVQVDVLAPDAETPTHGTTCQARALKGASVAAQCDTLASEGAIVVDIASVRAAFADPSCTELEEIVLTLQGLEGAESDGVSSISLGPEDCQGSARFSPVAKGARVIEASAPGRSSVSCSATVKPGLPAAPCLWPEEPKE